MVYNQSSRSPHLQNVMLDEGLCNTVPNVPSPTGYRDLFVESSYTEFEKHKAFLLCVIQEYLKPPATWKAVTNCKWKPKTDLHNVQSHGDPKKHMYKSRCNCVAPRLGGNTLGLNVE